MPLFHAPFNFFPFQADFALACSTNQSQFLAADTGLGKSVISIASACALCEASLVDIVLVACHSAKVGEWVSDFQSFTDLPVVAYRGSPAQRKGLLSTLNDLDSPQVLVGVYETLRNDLAHWEQTEKRKRGKKLVPGPLTKALVDRSVLLIADEASAKIGASRGSQLYSSTALFAKEMNKGSGSLRSILISATPMERDPEGFFNLTRIFHPIGTVEQFALDHIASYDLYGNPKDFCNLSKDTTQEGKTSLHEKVKDWLLIKRKTDPDVVESFPAITQEFSYVDFSAGEASLYRYILKLVEGSESSAGAYTALRQVCDHPIALALSEGALAQEIVTTFGSETLLKLGSSKMNAFLERMEMICHRQGSQAVVFTFYGQTVLPLLHQGLVERGITVSINHGQMSDADKDASKASFNAGSTQVFLSSDAGAYGINLPNAEYVEEYDFPRKFSTHIQRINRISRLSSVNPHIWANAWVTRDSLEEDILHLMLRRKGWSDAVIFDAIDNEHMAALIREGRRRHL